jgi:hypothetical protein
MGYYTSHKLEIVKGNDEFTDYEEEISKISGYNNPFDDSCKWYDHEKHMREYSKNHPNTLFKLIGDGEENGDMWHEYYLNGKMQRAKAEIVFADFDEAKLK